MTSLEFCIHAMRVNGGAPCDLECAANAEAELKALREDRATIDAMTTLLARARSERDKLRFAAQLAADWMLDESLEPAETTDDTSTFNDADIGRVMAQGRAIKQALLDALA